MILKVFTQPNCPKCPAAKTLIRQLKTKNLELKTEEFEVTTAEGLAEASFYTVMGTPSLILTDEKGKEIYGWRGEVPPMKEILKKLR